MKPHKLLNSNAVIALTVVLGTTSLLPSCALKRLADRESTEASAANAAALEEALAILDEATQPLWDQLLQVARDFEEGASNPALKSPVQIPQQPWQMTARPWRSLTHIGGLAKWPPCDSHRQIPFGAQAALISTTIT